MVTAKALEDEHVIFKALEEKRRRMTRLQLFKTLLPTATKRRSSPKMNVLNGP